MSVQSIALTPSSWLDPDRARRLIERLSPSQGWVTVLILLATLMIVGDSVVASKWVETPGLMSAIIWGTFAGLLLAKVRLPSVLLHPVGLGLGVVVVVWQTSSLIPDLPLNGQVDELLARLRDWNEAARTGGISTDLIPFTLILLSAAWLLGYISAWLVFRHNHVWIPVLLAGTALLTNLSFLPGTLHIRFFLFVLMAMLLVARMSIVQSEDSWHRSGVGFTSSSGWSSITVALCFSAVVLLIAGALPMKRVVSTELALLWRAGRAPITGFEEELGRLLSGVSAQKNLPGRYFGKTLPFLGTIQMDGEVVAYAVSDYPSYWASQTYSEYTPRGWIAGDTKALKFGPNSVAPPLADSVGRAEINQGIRLTFESKPLFSGGDLAWTSRDVLVETLSPKRFTVDLADSSSDSDLPEDIQLLAEELRRDMESPPEGLEGTPTSQDPDAMRQSFLESFISRTLPEDMVLIDTIGAEGERGSGFRWVVLERKEPIAPDVVSWRFLRDIPAETDYSSMVFASVSTDRELRSAQTDYRGFIRDHYLQLPKGLPQRVVDLAEQITRAADTPFDKARIVQAFLRGPRFTYEEEIEAPPGDSDGVDHFLFDSREGYSDYYASAMAVMLRAVGVPTRIAAGYGPGEYFEEEDLSVIRDSDSHPWVQVYFPYYGWIDFEPTPNWPVHERTIRGFTTEGVGFGQGEDPFFEEDPDAMFNIEPEGLNLPRLDDADGGFRVDVTRFLVPLAMAAGSAAFLWLVLQLAWTVGLMNATASEQAYAKMGRLSALAGIGRRPPQQTPAEYAERIGAAVPAIAGAAQNVALAFAQGRYRGGEGPDEAELTSLDRDWKQIRGSLVGRSISRWIPKALIGG